MSDNTSTVQSYIDSTTGLAQRAVGTVTGSTSTEEQGQTNQSTGQDNQSRPTGSWDQTIGSAKESIGNAIGHEDLRKQGVEQNATGKETEAKGQLQDLGEGVANRAQGAVGSIGAAVKGDREEEEKWRQMHDEGKLKQKEAEKDVDQRGGV